MSYCVAVYLIALPRSVTYDSVVVVSFIYVIISCFVSYCVVVYMIAALSNYVVVVIFIYVVVVVIII